MTTLDPQTQNATRLMSFELLGLYGESVMLLGSWNDWKPIPMQRSDDGVWRVNVDLPDGDYSYQFQVLPNNS